MCTMCGYTRGVVVNAFRRIKGRAYAGDRLWHDVFTSTSMTPFSQVSTRATPPPENSPKPEAVVHDLPKRAI